MKIEWNKVTWYSKLLVAVFFVLAICLAFYFGVQYQKIISLSSQPEYSSINKTCEGDLDCPAGESCLVTGPIVAGGTIQRNCYPAGQMAPMLQRPAAK